jgi:hypothetical protein
MLFVKPGDFIHKLFWSRIEALFVRGPRQAVSNAIDESRPLFGACCGPPFAVEVVICLSGIHSVLRRLGPTARRRYYKKQQQKRLHKITISD